MQFTPIQCSASSLVSAPRDPGKKTFMFFTSELGKGFIISDEEEVSSHKCELLVYCAVSVVVKLAPRLVAGTVTSTL